MEWKTDILHSLEERDRKWAINNPLFEQYDLIVKRLFLTEKKLNTFQESDLQVELQKALQEIEKLRNQSDSLSLGNREISKKSKKQEVEIKNLNSELKKIRDRYKRLHEQVIIKHEENQAKNKALNLINDDILALQLENNLLNEKVKKLETENNDLVVRWMNKMKEDAEKLNDANAFLENMRANSSKNY